MHTASNHIFLYMHKKSKIQSPTNSKIYSYLAISEINKTVLYTSIVYYMKRNAFIFH